VLLGTDPSSSMIEIRGLATVNLRMDLRCTQMEKESIERWWRSCPRGGECGYCLRLLKFGQEPLICYPLNVTRLRRRLEHHVVSMPPYYLPTAQPGEDRDFRDGREVAYASAQRPRQRSWPGKRLDGSQSPKRSASADKKETPRATRRNTEPEASRIVEPWCLLFSRKCGMRVTLPG